MKILDIISIFLLYTFRTCKNYTRVYEFIFQIMEEKVKQITGYFTSSQFFHPTIYSSFVNVDFNINYNARPDQCYFIPRN